MAEQARNLVYSQIGAFFCTILEEIISSQTKV